ncbi:MAG: hypothetical protein KKE66_08300 [Gammaproteobacteria bacterium]|nr:hypothetical protein [Gammaproteobacteria bacterium]MBU0857074.1 hypothetical protein [Gammaproteobacteria bacterium]MBU1847952.1 hypothetical protein [Gammaproteobacteria bacterium]
MAKVYQPPVQKGFGQFIDSMVLLVLVYLSLLAPLVLGGTASEAEADIADTAATWQALEQNETMQAQWEKLGYTPETAEPIVTKKFHYEVEPVSLGITVAVIVAYFFFMLKVSDREYREVINERFGPRGRTEA